MSDRETISMRSGNLGRSVLASPALLVVPTILLLLFTYVWPLLQVLRLSFSAADASVLDGAGFTLKHYIDFFLDPTSLRVIWRSFWISIASTIIALVVAYPYAISIARGGPMMRRLLISIALLPMTTSGVVRAYGVIMVLGREGPLNALLLTLGIVSRPVEFLYGPAALIIGNAYFVLPFVILPLATGIARIDRRLLDAASTLGATRLAMTRTVTLPLLVPAIAAGSVVAFTLNMTAFVTPGLLGGQGYLVITTLLGQQMFALANWITGAVIAVVLLAIVIVTMSVYQAWMDRKAKFYAPRS
ncbi:ABC transporter permease [Rhizobium sp. CG5]|uniref:ABC transporter permease n=1 Tax=Rhizobium sp. CG5 TaxID=2726076 RepID=UPI0020347BF2|nr:ABC transporter permease [Rhizobium sp. CG5]MCM2477238.1 ABC transporter permease [Rhizobium sp. CG5]